MLVSRRLVNDRTKSEEVLSERCPYVSKLVGLQLLQVGDDLRDYALSVENFAEVRKSSNCSSSYLRLRVLEEAREIRQQVLVRLLNSDASSEVHNAVRHKIPDAPALILSELFDVGQQVCGNFGFRQEVSELDTAVNALHPHCILVILVKTAEYVKQLRL